jgi:3-oxoacyl-[acyl-carrier-protein] synthase II
VAEQRVAVTGLGVITSLGLTVQDFWASLCAGRSGISRIESMSTDKYERKLGGEVKNFDPREHMDAALAGRIGRASQMAIAATRQAFESAGLDGRAMDPARTGVCFGTTSGEIQELEDMDRAWMRGGLAAIDPERVWRYPCYAISRNVGRAFDCFGPNLMLPNACAAGNFAMAYGMDLIRSGKVERMVVGGADPWSLLAFTGFCRLGSYAKETPKPFSKNRDGMMLGEGAAVLILERMDLARQRNAPLHAELLGYGISSDAYHITAPSPDGGGLARAMKAAMEHARIGPAEVDYVCAHGTGTPANDTAESKAIRSALPNYRDVPVSSIKSALGHTLGAASAIESVACVQALKEQILPPTTFYEEDDPNCGLNIVAHQGREGRLNLVLNCASAFGGNNAVVVLGRAKN